MPTTWKRADLTWSAATYTWSDFSIATELLFMLEEGGRSGKYKRDKWGRVIDGPYADFFKDPEKKRKVIELIMKVKSNKIKQKVEIPMDVKIVLSDIDMVIQEVLQKPTVNIHVS